MGGRLQPVCKAEDSETIKRRMGDIDGERTAESYMGDGYCGAVS